jgi:hypothetical protein
MSYAPFVALDDDCSEAEMRLRVTARDGRSVTAAAPGQALMVTMTGIIAQRRDTGSTT